jgi:hypothetical protein
MSNPIQTAWCFICGNEIRRSTIPPAIWVHNDMGGLRDHDALPDVDEAVRDALAAVVQRAQGWFDDRPDLVMYEPDGENMDGSYRVQRSYYDTDIIAAIKEPEENHV